MRKSVIAAGRFAGTAAATSLLLLVFGMTSNIAQAAVDTLWVQETSGTFDLTADGNRAMTVDASGNIYAVGQSRNLNANDDILLVKYASNGALIWSKSIESSSGSNDYGRDVLVGSDGNVVVIGTFAQNSSVRNRICVSKRNSQSGLEIWSQPNIFQQFNRQRALGAALDQDDNVYVVGWGDNTSPASDADGNLLIIKYSWNGDSLAAYAGLPDAAYSRYKPYTVAFDHGYLYIAGRADSINVATGSPRPSEYLACLLKLSPQLNGFIWSSYYGITDVNGDQYISEWYRTRNIDFDASGNVYASTWGTGWGPNEHGRVALSKFSGSTGSLIWTRPSPWTNMTKTDERFDGGVVVRVNRTSGRVYMCAQNLYVGIILYGFDLNGNQLWSPVTYSFPGATDAEEVTTDMQLKGNDSAVVAGFRLYAGTGEGVSAPFVVKFNTASPAGVAWAYTKLKLSSNVDNLDAVKIDPQGNIIFAGPADVVDNTQSHLYVAKLSERIPYGGPNWYVNASKGSDVTGDGSSDYPFKTIQPAVDSAKAGHVILVASGTYPPLAVKHKNLTIRGTKGRDSTFVQGVSGSRCVLVDTVSSGIVSLVGFTLTGGSLVGSGVDKQGGGLLARAASVKIDSCTISGNQSGDSGGGLSFRDRSYFEITNSRICSNTSHWSGGGLVGVNAAGGKLSRTMFFANNADTNGGGVFVIGTAYSPADSLTIANCVFSGNKSTEGGAGIGVNKVHLNLRNTIVYNNTRLSGTKPLYGVFDTSNVAEIGADDYNDVYGNVSGYNYGGQISKGLHSISLDPLFVVQTCANASLGPCSPCVDAGDPNVLPLVGGGSYSDIGIRDTIFNCPVTDVPPTVNITNPAPIQEGETFAPIYLDGFVTDPDDRFDQITWSHSGGAPLICSISPGRVATITTPNKDWCGSATIRFTATDKGGGTGYDDVTFTINCVNDAPVVSGILNQVLAYGATFASISLDSYVSDPDNTPSQMTWTHVGDSALIVSINPTTHVATITKPSPTWTGFENIAFCAEDPGHLSGCGEAVFSIGVPPPTIRLDTTAYSFSAGERGSNPSPQTMHIRNMGGQTFAWNAARHSSWLTLSDSSGVPDDSIVLSITVGTLVSGTYIDTVNVTAAAASNSPQKAIVKLVISPNMPPEAQNDTLTLNEDVDTPVSLIADDPENDSLVYALVSAPAHGKIVDFDSLRGTLVYHPYQDYNGSDLLTFETSDRLHLSNIARVFFTILPVNDAPVVTGIPSQKVTEGSGFGPTRLDEYATDVDGPDSLLNWTYSIIDTFPNPPCRGALQVAISDRIAYVEATDLDVFGSIKVIFTAEDTGHLSSSDTITYEITNTPDAPRASDTSYTLSEDNNLVANMLAYSPDCDPIKYVITEPPTHGRLDSSEYDTPRFTYRPDQDYYGLDSFGFRALDDGNNTTSQKCKVNISIAPVNDPPAFIASIPGQIVELGDSFARIELDGLVSDVDNDLSSLHWTAKGANNFQVDIEGGKATVSQPNDGTPRSDRIVFCVTDTGGLVACSTAVFAVHATDYPVANLGSQKYRMVTLPLDPDSHLAGTIRNQLNGRNEYDWRMWRWNPVSETYVDALDSLSPGSAFWVIVKNGQVLSITGTATIADKTDGYQDYRSLKLLPGWNQIGNPFSYEIEFYDSQVRQFGGLVPVGSTESPVRAALYHYDGTGWDGLITDAPAPMAVGDGYFINVDSTCSDCALWYTTKEYMSARDLKRANAGSDETECNLAIRAECFGYHDDCARLGVKRGAADGLDRFDLPAAPAFSPYVRVVFGNNYATDFRSEADSSLRWRFRVQTDLSKPVTLYLRAAMPDNCNLQFELTDLATFRTAVFADSLQYSFEPDAEERVFDCRLLRPGESGGTYQSGVPGWTQLHDAYPNPFNSSLRIPFDLTSPASVRLTILNALGQVVREYNIPRVAAGSHSIEWDGKDAAGVIMASGVYFCRFQAGDYVQSKKMVFLK